MPTPCASFAAFDVQHGLLIGADCRHRRSSALLLVAVLTKYGVLWLQAYMCGADVSLLSLIGMSFRPGSIPVRSSSPKSWVRRRVWISTASAA